MVKESLVGAYGSVLSPYECWSQCLVGEVWILEAYVLPLNDCCWILHADK